MVFNIQEDFVIPTEKAIQKSKSYLGKIPSQDLNEDQYDLFLTIASPEELEQDIITIETLFKIVFHPITPNRRL